MSSRKKLLLTIAKQTWTERLVSIHASPIGNLSVILDTNVVLVYRFETVNNLDEDGPVLQAELVLERRLPEEIFPSVTLPLVKMHFVQEGNILVACCMPPFSGPTNTGSVEQSNRKRPYWDIGLWTAEAHAPWTRLMSSCAHFWPAIPTTGAGHGLILLLVRDALNGGMHAVALEGPRCPVTTVFDLPVTVSGGYPVGSSIWVGEECKMSNFLVPFWVHCLRSGKSIGCPPPEIRQAVALELLSSDRVSPNATAGKDLTLLCDMIKLDDSSSAVAETCINLLRVTDGGLHRTILHVYNHDDRQREIDGFDDFNYLESIKHILMACKNAEVAALGLLSLLQHVGDPVDVIPVIAELKVHFAVREENNPFDAFAQKIQLSSKQSDNNKTPM